MTPVMYPNVFLFVMFKENFVFQMPVNLFNFGPEMPLLINDEFVLYRH
jgi:hypothetical protein